MSLKENVDFIKKELNTEEQFLEGFVKVERFYKKNKKFIFSGIALIVVVILGVFVKDYLDEQNKIKSNIAFNQFLEDNNNTKALEELKSLNKKLYEVALFMKSKNAPISEKIENRYLNTLIDYTKALETKSVEQLNDITIQNEFLLKDFALFNKALLLTQEKKYEEAKETIKQISENSQISDLLAKLNHYLITK